MGILSAREAAHLILDGVLGVSPLEAGQLQASSIVLRLGAELEIPEPGQTIDPCSDQHVKGRAADLAGAPFELAPGQCAIGETMEKLSIPAFCAGAVYGMNELALFGLETGACRLDPGFSGHVRLFIRNAGYCALLLRRGMPFCRLELSALHEEPAPWRSRPRDEEDMRRMAEFLKREFEDSKPHGVLSRYLEESIREACRRS